MASGLISKRPEASDLGADKAVCLVVIIVEERELLATVFARPDSRS